MREPKAITKFVSPDGRITIRFSPNDYPYSAIEIKDQSNPEKSFEFDNPYRIFWAKWWEFGLTQSHIDWISSTMEEYTQKNPLTLSIDFNSARNEVAVTRRSDCLSAVFSIETTTLGRQQVDVIRTNFRCYYDFFETRSFANSITRVFSKQLEPLMDEIRNFLTESAKASKSEESLKEAINSINSKSLPEPDC